MIRKLNHLLCPIDCMTALSLKTLAVLIKTIKKTLSCFVGGRPQESVACIGFVIVLTGLSLSVYPDTAYALTIWGYKLTNQGFVQSDQARQHGNVIELTKTTDWGSIGFAYGYGPLPKNAWVVDFDFSISQSKPSSTLGDGISFFLTTSNAPIPKRLPDNSSTACKIGWHGGLGYGPGSQHRRCGRQAGLQGAVLGIGFDAYGNFSTAQGGANGIQRTPNAIVIRGAQKNNYPLIAHKTVAMPISSKQPRWRTARVALTRLEKGGYELVVSVRNKGESQPKPDNTLTIHLDSLPQQTLRYGFAATTSGTAIQAAQSIGTPKVFQPMDLAVSGTTDINKDGVITYHLKAKKKGRVNGWAQFNVKLPEFLEVTQGLTCQPRVCRSGTDSPTSTAINFNQRSEVNLQLKGQVKNNATTGGHLIATIAAPAGQTDSVPGNNQVSLPIRLIMGKVATLTQAQIQRLRSQDSNLSEAIGVKQHRVTLHQKIPLSGTLISTLTDDQGFFRLPSLPEATYHIVTSPPDEQRDGKTIALSEQVWGGAGSFCKRTIAETSQRYLDAGWCFGGDVSRPHRPIGQHLIRIENMNTLLLAEHMDFGFSYDVVTHVEDTGRGSLRQVISNANHSYGSGSVLFVPTLRANANNRWQINTQSNYLLTKEGLVINGKAWSLASPDKPAIDSPMIHRAGPVGKNQQPIERFLQPDLNVISQASPVFKLTGMDNNSRT